MGDLVLFSPNGAALRRTNTSVLHPPSWPHAPDTPCYSCLCEQRGSTSLFLCLHVCVCLRVCARVCSGQFVFPKLGKLMCFFFLLQPIRGLNHSTFLHHFSVVTSPRCDKVPKSCAATILGWEAVAFETQKSSLSLASTV